VKDEGLTILIDRREQRPLSLPNSELSTLKTGDYSIRTDTEDYREQIAVERKSLEDLYGCFGQSRDRFERELERLAKFPYPAIVVEATLAEVLGGTQYSKVHPQSAIGSLIAWSVKHRIPCWLAGDRRMAAGTVRKILYAGVKYIQGE
jgi:ERCC4-type nuclease